MKKEEVYNLSDYYLLETTLPFVHFNPFVTGIDLFVHIRCLLRKKYICIHLMTYGIKIVLLFMLINNKRTKNFIHYFFAIRILVWEILSVSGI